MTKTTPQRKAAFMAAPAKPAAKRAPASTFVMTSKGNGSEKDAEAMRGLDKLFGPFGPPPF
jgi:hypothetical protein